MRPPILPIAEGLPHAASIIKRGGVVAFPTETVYGLGASIGSIDGLKRIYDIKGRAWSEPLIVLLDHASSAHLAIREIPDHVRHMLQHGWPTGLTVLLPARPDLPGVFVREQHCAVRVTSLSHAQNLIRLVGTPISGTSANRSGEPPATSAEEAAALNVDLVLDGGPSTGVTPSTLARPTDAGWEIIRQGIAQLPVQTGHQTLESTWKRTTVPTIDGWVWQPERGYRFSIDSILLASFTLPLLQGADRVVDMGSGTGVLSLILAKRSAVPRIDAIEVMEEFHNAMAMAVRAQGLAHRIDPVCGDLTYSRQFLPGNMYDLAIVNPPYYKSGSGRLSPRRSKATANSEEYAPLSLFLEDAKRVLKQGGLLSIIIPENRLQETLTLADKLSLHLGYLQPVYPNSRKGANRLMLGLIKNRAPSLKILQPMHIFNLHNRYTKKMSALLQTPDQ